MQVLITGGTKGIGLATAVAFARDGATVYLGYSHDDAAAEQAATKVTEAGGRAITVSADVGNPADVARLVATVREQTKHLDCIVHCAVQSFRGGPSDLDVDEFDRAVRVNGAALFYVVRAALDLVGEGSSVFFLSSQGAKTAIRGYFGLGAPKALAEAIMRYLTIDLAPRGVRCFTITPGALPTEAFDRQFPQSEKVLAAVHKASPVGRGVEFDDVTGLITFLAGNRREMLTGGEFLVDGGLHLKG